MLWSVVERLFLGDATGNTSVSVVAASCDELRRPSPLLQPKHTHSLSLSSLDIFTTSPVQHINMAGKMDIDAVNGEKKEESVGPAPELTPERSALPSSASYSNRRC